MCFSLTTQTNLPGLMSRAGSLLVMTRPMVLPPVESVIEADGVAWL